MVPAAVGAGAAADKRLGQRHRAGPFVKFQPVRSEEAEPSFVLFCGYESPAHSLPPGRIGNPAGRQHP